MLELSRHFVLWSGCVLIAALSYSAEDQNPSTQKLIDRAMQAQVAAHNDNSRFEYVFAELSQEKTETYRVLETDDGDVQRKIAINDQELTPQQRDHEDRFLQKLLAEPSIQQNRWKEDTEENARRQKIIIVLGKAFLYDIEGTEKDGQIVRLHFLPNPQFHPESREAKVCAGLEGTMWVNQDKQRFTRAEGTLVRDVDFGWGILGHLKKGGHFEIEQTEVDPGNWRITNLDLNFKGSMLIFKSLNIKVHEHSSHFRRISDHISLQDAVEMLREPSSLDAFR